MEIDLCKSVSVFQGFSFWESELTLWWDKRSGEVGFDFKTRNIKNLCDDGIDGVEWAVHSLFGQSKTQTLFLFSFKSNFIL